MHIVQGCYYDEEKSVRKENRSFSHLIHNNGPAWAEVVVVSWCKGNVWTQILLGKTTKCSFLRQDPTPKQEIRQDPTPKQEILCPCNILLSGFVGIDFPHYSNGFSSKSFIPQTWWNAFVKHKKIQRKWSARFPEHWSLVGWAWTFLEWVRCPKGHQPKIHHILQHCWNSNETWLSNIHSHISMKHIILHASVVILMKFLVPLCGLITPSALKCVYARSRPSMWLVEQRMAIFSCGALARTGLVFIWPRVSYKLRSIQSFFDCELS